MGRSTTARTSGSTTVRRSMVVGHPVIAPTALNWHNVATVANFSGQDPNSAIQSCSRNVPVSGPSSTLTKVASGSCNNFAGLTGHGGYAYRFDNTPPSLAPTVSPNPVLRGATATASPNATDAHSGVASASCGTPETSTIGLHTVACIARASRRTSRPPTRSTPSTTASTASGHRSTRTGPTSSL